MPEVAERVDVVVLASGINHIQLFDGYQPGYKALLPFKGVPAIAYVLAALRASGRVGRICIVGPEDALRSAVGEEPVEFVSGGETLMDSIYSGLDRFAGDRMVLVTTADLPLLTPEAINDFLAGCHMSETTFAENLFLAMVPQRCYTGLYAKVTKAFNRFRGLAACHGNLMLADPKLIHNPHVTRRMNALYNSRKNPLSSALAIGLHLGLTYVLGVHLWHLLSIDKMASMASSRFQLGLIPVLIDHPGVTVDVDEPEDYALVQEILTAE